MYQGIVEGLDLDIERPLREEYEKEAELLEKEQKELQDFIDKNKEELKEIYAKMPTEHKLYDLDT